MMQGIITPTQAISNLYWSLERLIYDSSVSSLGVYINLYLSIQDRNDRKILCTRSYNIPLNGTDFLNQGQELIGQLLNAAVASDGQFNLNIDS